MSELGALRQQLAERDAKLAERDAELTTLRSQNAKFRKMVFGPRSEKTTANIQRSPQRY